MQNTVRPQFAAHEWRLWDLAVMLLQAFRIQRHADITHPKVKAFRARNPVVGTDSRNRGTSKGIVSQSKNRTAGVAQAQPQSGPQWNGSTGVALTYLALMS